MENIRFTLSIFGDNFNPEELTKTLGIQPTEFWFKNDPIPRYKNKIVRKETSWELTFIGTTLMVLMMLLRKC